MAVAKRETQMKQTRSEYATLGGGCFWCTEAVFRRAPGVLETACGYSAGSMKSPDYQAVCSGRTGHAEVIQLQFDPEIISYPQLLDIFFAIHDPTAPHRQGADIGTQYRSIILYNSTEQHDAAFAAIIEQTKQRQCPVATELEAASHFYRAEDAHQDYYGRHPDQPYCRAVILPKISYLKDVGRAEKGPETPAGNDNE